MAPPPASAAVSLTERRVRANGLQHHVLQWEPATLVDDLTIVCTHGFLDVGASWRGVAERLAAGGRRVIAFDWRGHGDTDWLAPGGYYYFPDYVADLAELVDAFAPSRLCLVAHSMGGSASIMYAASFPERVERLVLVEGMGPPPHEPPSPPDRVRLWIDQMRIANVRRNNPLVFGGFGDVLARIRTHTPDLSDALGAELAERSTRPAPGGSGRIWAWDPLHKTHGPFPFDRDVFMSFIRAIRAPTLLVDGEHGFRLEDREERQAAFRDVRALTIPGVGHAVHWFAPDALAAAIDAFVQP